MKFETVKLTYRTSLGSFTGKTRYRDIPAASGGVIACDRSACASGLEDRGWLLPRVRGGAIVLVFSTIYVKGASRCKVAYLRAAGRDALEQVSRPIMRAGLWSWSSRIRYGVVFFEDGNEMLLGDNLWWWPEIVSGGSS